MEPRAGPSAVGQGACPLTPAHAWDGRAELSGSSWGDVSGLLVRFHVAFSGSTQESGKIPLGLFRMERPKAQNSLSSV